MKRDLASIHTLGGGLVRLPVHDLIRGSFVSKKGVGRCYRVLALVGFCYVLARIRSRPKSLRGRRFAVVPEIRSDFIIGQGDSTLFAGSSVSLFESSQLVLQGI